MDSCWGKPVLPSQLPMSKIAVGVAPTEANLGSAGLLWRVVTSATV